MRNCGFQIAKLKILSICLVMIMDTSSFSRGSSDVVGVENDFLSSAEFSQLPKAQLDAFQKRRRLVAFEKDGKGRVERLDDYARIFCEQNVFDARLNVCKLRATALTADGSTSVPVAVSGEVLEGRYKTGFAGILEQLGFDVKNNTVSVLPVAEFEKKYAYAPPGPDAVTLRAEPRPNSEQINTAVPGMWVRLLRPAELGDLKIPAERVADDIRSSVGDWVLGQTEEGYVGFVPVKMLSQPTDQLIVPEGMLLESSEAGGVPVAAGSMLMRDGTNWCVVSPGQKSHLPKDIRVAVFGQPDTEARIMETMKTLLGQKYVWGGRTDRGVDCSGLTQWYARTRGVMLPRDAAEQSICGRITAFGMDAVHNARAGDLIFFANGDGRVSHVGVSLGDGKLLHSSSHPGVIVQQLADEGNHELAARILFSRRLW